MLKNKNEQHNNSSKLSKLWRIAVGAVFFKPIPQEEIKKTIADAAKTHEESVRFIEESRELIKEIDKCLKSSEELLNQSAAQHR